MADARRRPLLAGHLLPVGHRLWVVDRVQPVAVVLDAGNGAVVAEVGWPDVAPGPSPGSGWQVRPAADGIWVQQPGGPVALVTEDGLRSGHHSAGWALSASLAHGAWCLPAPPHQDIAATEDEPPSPLRSGERRVRLVRPGRTTATVRLPAAVTGARSHHGDLYLSVQGEHWNRRNLGTPTAWDLEVETVWLRVGADDPVPEEVTLAAHRCLPPAPVRPSEVNGGQWLGSPWAPSGPPSAELVEESGVGPEQSAGRRWYAGWDPDRRTRPRHVVVGAWPGSAGDGGFRQDLGAGTVTAMCATVGSLWLAVEAPRHTATYTRPTPTSVLRVSGTGEVEEVLAAGAVDITARCWPLPPEPVDTGDYTAQWAERFAGLDDCWVDQHGARHPLARGLHDSAVEVVGRWPDTSLHLTFGYDQRPGSRLRRVVPLFDELGRQVPPEYADIHLMEDLETGAVPAEPDPGADHLDV